MADVLIGLRTTIEKFTTDDFENEQIQKQLNEVFTLQHHLYQCNENIRAHCAAYLEPKYKVDMSESLARKAVIAKSLEKELDNYV